MNEIWPKMALTSCIFAKIADRITQKQFWPNFKYFSFLICAPCIFFSLEPFLESLEDVHVNYKL